MDRTYLEWNFVNWITVVLMASFGLLLIGLVTSGLKGMKMPSPTMADPTAAGA